MLSREILSMEKLHHPNVVRLFEVIETFSKVYLVMEFAAAGELYQRVTSQGRLNEETAKTLFAQIVSAIDHMVSTSRRNAFAPAVCVLIPSAHFRLASACNHPPGHQSRKYFLL
jgi:serine/threonine protein kinase